jgi:hypothetical protein
MSRSHPLSCSRNGGNSRHPYRPETPARSAARTRRRGRLTGSPAQQILDPPVRSTIDAGWSAGSFPIRIPATDADNFAMVFITR